MNKTNIVKIATSSIVGAGVMHITDGIVKSNVHFDDLNSFGKFTVAAARVALGSMTAAKTKQHTDACIDELIVNWQNAQSSTTETITTV